MATTDNQTITLEITADLSIEKIWAFLMNESTMKSWFEADEFVIDIIEGGKVEIPLIIEQKEVLIEGEIGLILPMKEFAFTWIERNSSGEAWFNNTTVTIGLEELETGTKIALVHDGFQYLDEEIQQETRIRYQSFWDKEKMLERLCTLVFQTDDDIMERDITGKEKPTQ